MISNHNWAPVVRWVLLLLGLGSSWWTMSSGEMPVSMWLGISAIVLAGAFGARLLVVGAFLALFFLRYAMFLMPMSMVLNQATWVGITITIAFSVWEAAPLWLAGVIGVWALRRRETIPTWAMGILVVSAHLTLAVWLPRPYHFSWGAPLLARFPGAVWMFGSDLLAALALAWVCVMARTIVFGTKTWAHTIVVAALPLGSMLVCAATYESWAGRMIAVDKETHDVVVVQGALPPFAGGFAATSDRILTPVILYSALKPDLVIFPECMVQAGGELDKNESEHKAKRHYASVGIGIASPYSQVVYGVRDWNQNRIYFTDIIDGKPDVSWKDMEFRTPFVDVWPKSLNRLVDTYGFKGAEQIFPATRTPNMSLLVRDETQPRGLRKIGTGLIAMSGEIRRPLQVMQVRKDNSINVAINPTIAGWLGANEGRGSALQSNARAMELGVTLYRVGQRMSTGIFVPWLRDTSDDVVQRFGPGSLRFKARIPTSRRGTGFTSVFFVSLYLAPLAFVFTFLWLALGWYQRPREEPV